MLEALPIYLAVGAFAGLLAGLFGVGGGLVIVPVLAFVFRAQGVDAAVLMHLAIGTSLATIVFTSLASVHAHHRRGAVLWPVFARLVPGIVLGAWLGAAVADALPGMALRRVFGIFELVVAAQLALDLRPAPHRGLPGPFGTAIAGAVIGAVSAIVGIGGGTLTVPFLTWCNVAMKNAVATSAAAGLPIALAGAIGFLAAGWGEPSRPAGSTGYLYWPALLGIVAASMPMAPFGARLAHSLPGALLKRIFAGFLALLGIAMLTG
jgi:uncharacterized membrane protein YfcA